MASLYCAASSKNRKRRHLWNIIPDKTILKISGRLTVWHHGNVIPCKHCSALHRTQHWVRAMCLFDPSFTFTLIIPYTAPPDIYRARYLEVVCFRRLAARVARAGVSPQSYFGACTARSEVRLMWPGSESMNVMEPLLPNAGNAVILWNKPSVSQAALHALNISGSGLLIHYSCFHADKLMWDIFKWKQSP